MSVSVLKGCFFENRDNGFPKRLYPLPSPLPRGEGTNCRESQQWSDFSYLIPSPRGRGLGRGQKQSNPPEASHSTRRKVVAWALPTKTWKTPYHSPSFLKTLPVGKAHATVLYKPTLLSDDLSHKLGRLKPANQPYCPFGYRYNQPLTSIQLITSRHSRAGGNPSKILRNGY